MSLQAAKDFLNELDRTPALQDELRDTVQAEVHIIQVAQKHQYDFSPAELEEALHDKWDNSTFYAIAAKVTFSQTPGF